MSDITVADMQRHAEQLCRDHEIDWRANRTRNAYCFIDLRNIYTPPIRGPVSYGAVMHEIGHILGRHNGSRHVMTREVWAWRWARANALLWTPETPLVRV